MQTLDRYIGTVIVRGYFLVMLVLLALFAFLDFVDQLEDLGKGNYQVKDIGLFVLLMLPRHFLELVSVTVLLGGTLALGGLANSSELVAMRAGGVSVGQIGFSVLKTGILMMLIVIALEQFIAPPLQQFAYEYRLTAISATLQQRSESGLWSRNGLSFINIGDIRLGRIPSDIEVYEFDETGRLILFIHADSADIINHNQWRLKDVLQKTFDGQRLVTLRLPDRTWEAFLTAEQVQILEPPVESLSVTDLFYFVRYLRASQQRTARYELALWEKITLPLSTGAMALMSVPFVFGLPRVANTGQRVLVGALIGIGFYLLNQIFANLGLLLNLNPALATLTPSAIIIGFAAFLLRRVH
jgi:lipopolysaccharide export system permease protein